MWTQSTFASARAVRFAALIAAFIALVGCGADDTTPAAEADTDGAIASALDADDGASGDVEDIAAGDDVAVGGADVTGDSALGDVSAVDVSAADAKPSDAADGAAALCGGVACPAAPDACTAYACENDACVLVAANESEPCDDGVVCTASTRCKAGVCGGGVWTCKCGPAGSGAPPNACASMNPLNQCLGTFACVQQGDGSYDCALDPATKVVCDASLETACLSHSCEAKTGSCVLQPKPEFVNCDDGDACTASDVCVKGVCKGQVNLCECDADNAEAACAKIFQGFAGPCTGIWTCANPGVGPPKQDATPEEKAAATHCELDKSAVPDCGELQGVPCASAKCVDEGGKAQCAFIAKNEGKLCDDGDPCTPNDLCKGGSCIAEPTNICGCKSDADCADKDDGDLCNGVPYCEANKCKHLPAQVVQCPKLDGPCLTSVCVSATGQCTLAPADRVVTHIIQDPATGKVKQTLVTIAPSKFKLVFCEDGNSCTPVDSCVDGSCVPDDTNTCFACSKDADCADKDDGDACTGAVACIAGTCQVAPSSPIVCTPADSASCGDNVCDGATGKCVTKPQAKGVVCSGAATLATGGLCDGAGVCAPPAGVVAKCVVDADCVGALGPCASNVFCDKKAGTCAVDASKTPPCSAQPANACKVATCDPKTATCGEANRVDGWPCDDGVSCTGGDHCLAGACVAGWSTCPATP